MDQGIVTLLVNSKCWFYEQLKGILKDRGMGCAYVTHLRLINSRFHIFYVKMKHFEANLMVSSRVADSKVLRMAIQFEYFSDKKVKWRI